MAGIMTQWREKIAEPLEEIQEKVRQQWLGLNARERLILSILAGVLCLLLSVLILKEATTFFFRSELEAQNNLRSVEKIQRISQELLAQRSEMQRYDRLKEKRGDGFKISSFIEKQAQAVGINISRMAPTKALTAENETDADWVEVQVKEASLESSTQFLSSVEEALGVRLVELEMKPLFSDVTKIEFLAIFSVQKEL